MLAVFNTMVAKCPKELRVEQGGGDIAGGAEAIVNHYAATKEDVVVVGLGSCGAIAYTAKNYNPSIPRLFASIDDIYCSFQGRFENLSFLLEKYGLGEGANEATAIIEVYRTRRESHFSRIAEVVLQFRGKFAFILFDGSTKSTFITADSELSVPFFWGTDPGGNMVLSDDVDIMKTGCGRSFARFPKGCLFTTSNGLQSYEYPLNEVMAETRVDSQGLAYGANFTVPLKRRKKDIVGAKTATNVDNQGEVCGATMVVAEMTKLNISEMPSMSSEADISVAEMTKLNISETQG